MPKKDKDSERAILETVVFFDLFDYPLDLKELSAYLGGNLGGKLKEKKGDLIAAVEQSAFLNQKAGFFFLRGREILLETREKKQLHSEKLWKDAQKMAARLAFIPFLKAVFVCNNLAYGNASLSSDIDFFIVAGKGRLFFVRTLVTLVVQAAGMRRSGQKISGRICLSFFADETDLNLSKIALPPKDVYLLHWLKTIKSLLDKGGVALLEKANSPWLRNYFSGRYSIDRSKERKIGRAAKNISRWGERLLGKTTGDWIENILKSWQMARAIKKKAKLHDASGIIISSSMLKFHNVDRRRGYNDAWWKKMNSLIIGNIVFSSFFL